MNSTWQYFGDNSIVDYDLFDNQFDDQLVQFEYINEHFQQYSYLKYKITVSRPTVSFNNESDLKA